jgi:hypothetical protein
MELPVTLEEDAEWRQLGKAYEGSSAVLQCTGYTSALTGRKKEKELLLVLLPSSI